MADVYGRLTGRAGVCLSTLGPGATNLVTGVADREYGPGASRGHRGPGGHDADAQRRATSISIWSASSLL